VISNFEILFPRFARDWEIGKFGFTGKALIIQFLFYAGEKEQKFLARKQPEAISQFPNSQPEQVAYFSVQSGGQNSKILEGVSNP
jgi:hypothetical protein